MMTQVPLVLAACLLTAATTSAASGPPVPRTAVLTETSTDSQGASVSARRIVAVRSDGSELEISGPASRESHRAIFADGVVAKWVPSVKAKQTRRSSHADFQAFFVNARRDPAARCLSAGETDGGDETIGGIKSVKVALGGPNMPEIQMWYAPEFGCQLVRQVVSYRHPQAGTAILVLESLKKGEPDPSQFAIPSDYEEVSAAELDRRLAVRQ